ncbi:molt-inhibiting hormone-like [Penaeus chinensis]|uniref:molt-inhibiting hormone-like n=1 Tax=Penaeus chinensis TaxID=139456 RepID=UPI001FB7FA34|nr:molt-inhibiting hormone-like [Penaeus chinensis]
MRVVPSSSQDTGHISPKATRMMASPRGTSSIFKKACQVALVAAVLSGLLSSPASARFIDDECVGAMGNRNIYEKVARVCDDCSNIFRLPNVGESCRRNCFYNEDFLWCIMASERHAEVEQFNRWISILKAGRK